MSSTVNRNCGLFRVIQDGALASDDVTIKPGDWVTHTTYAGVGVVVAITDEQLSVLWSQAPRGGFGSIKFPTVRRVSQTTIANEIVKVQPMTAPAGAIFYFDYTYETERHRLCTTGPWVNRMFWRACFWMRSHRSRLTWSSLRSWLRSAFGRKSTSSGTPRLTDDEYRKMLLQKWSPLLKGAKKDE